MKRMHVHVRVADLAHNIRFYSALFGAPPAVVKDDYAKWMLEDPRLNFAISTRTGTVGLDHLGFQVETDDELSDMERRLATAELPIESEPGAACCYAKSNKHWTVDPQGIAWESYQTLQEIPTFNQAAADAQPANACCAPAAAPVNISIKPQAAGCCTPRASTSDTTGPSTCC
ncbi:ArsI/CadI family heavy metal resistance metalloenzyme [Imbroritus primus]|uniref:ArsI/CadI family heavy metal resistance metalloenzyme n=1 Tax=Imbroritus primus TaxID=3058603 RepID=UPI003D162167